MARIHIPMEKARRDLNASDAVFLPLDAPAISLFLEKGISLRVGYHLNDVGTVGLHSIVSYAF